MPLIDKKILYVEDEDIIAEEMVSILEDEVDTFTLARNGKEGLEKFGENSFDMIITDINMPVMNGIDMITQIRKENKDIPIIVVSAYNDTEYLIKTIELNVTGYILKPTNLDQLFNILNNTVEKLDLIKENLEYKRSLEQKVNEQVELIRQKDRVLQIQSKHAAMGEMIDAIAHQWKQPINLIKMNTELLTYDFEDGLLNSEKITHFSDKTNSYISHILNTLEEFRGFLRPDKEVHKFNANDAINSVLVLVKDEFIKNNIEVDINLVEDIEVNAIENEFKHVILNIINNAKDAFKDNNISDEKKIHFTLKDENDKHIIEICDNAGGIPENIIDKVFEANITTKEEGKGTGIGLYMSKQIIEKIGGVLTVYNKDNGACFKIELNN